LNGLPSSTSRQSQAQRKLARAERNKESLLWKKIKDGVKHASAPLEATRLESWSIPGLPDVLLYNGARFSLLELKVVKRGSRVHVSPHQVAWHMRHDGSPCFFVVRCPELNIHVFAGGCAARLGSGSFLDVPPLGIFEEPYDWASFFDLTAP
jgi:hypothetical protein